MCLCTCVLQGLCVLDVMALYRFPRTSVILPPARTVAALCQEKFIPSQASRQAAILLMMAQAWPSRFSETVCGLQVVDL